MARIENWALTASQIGPYMLPRESGAHLHGVITKHGLLRDGMPAITTEVTELNLRERLARTRNTYYDLGEPDPDWLAWCEQCGVTVKLGEQNAGD